MKPRCGEVGGEAAGAVLEGGSTSVVIDDSNCTDVQIDYNCSGCGTCVSPTCKGDINGDNWVTLPDMYMCIGKMTAAGPPYQIGPTDPNYIDCMDMNNDCWNMLDDMYMLIGTLSGAGPPYQIPCP